MLYEKKDSERKGRKKTKSWRVGLDEKSNDTSYGRGGLEKSPCLSIDCINIQWTVAGLYQVAHLGLRVCDCV